MEAAILASAAHTTAKRRRAVADFCRALAQAPQTPTPLSGALATWVDKVAKHAYKTIDEEVAALRSAGLTEDEIFELTVSAAYGAARGRYDLAMTAIDAGYAS